MRRLLSETEFVQGGGKRRGGSPPGKKEGQRRWLDLLRRPGERKRKGRRASVSLQKNFLSFRRKRSTKPCTSFSGDSEDCKKQKSQFVAPKGTEKKGEGKGQLLLLFIILIGEKKRREKDR